MSKKDKRRKGEGNNLLNTVMISPQGEVVYQGKYADGPIVKEENGVRRVFSSDGALIMEVPLDGLERDNEWFATFKDPDKHDIEVLPTVHIATGELYHADLRAVTKLPSANDYWELDREAVSRFNDRYRDTPYELQITRGPSYGSGDIEAAGVILLYANGGYDPAVDKLQPIEFSVPGWPLTWLAPEAAEVHPGAHRWCCSRLRSLIEKFGAQLVSQKVASLNIVPWSSTQYRSGCRLPSRDVQLQLAREAAARGAILVAVRARKAWEPVLNEFPDQVVDVRSARCSYISRGNLGPEGWQRVVDAVESDQAAE